MSLSRQDRLQVLGLWPAWRLRAPVEHTPEIEATRQPIQQPVSVIAVPEQVASPARPTPELILKETLQPTSQPELQESVPLAPVGDQRHIGDMDWTTLNAAIQSCTRCELAKSRLQAVPGVGDPHAEWLFIGEAPGANEDRQGEPFVGDAGKLLDAILAAIGLARGNNVFIANVLKSRPPANRDPKPDEVAACLPYLERQIELIQPKLIVALGRFAAQSLLATDTPIGKLRGQVHRYRGVPLVVTYHPAYLLRNPLDKAKVWEDLVLARNTMQSLKT